MEITRSKTVANVVSENVGSDHVFSKYEIDFCCGGDQTMEKVCEDKEISFEIIKKEIEKVSKILNEETTFDKLDITESIDYTVNVHHKYVKDHFPALIDLTAKVAQVHGNEHKEIVEINILFSRVISKINEQISIEETIIFPFTKKFIIDGRYEFEPTNSSLEILESSIKSIEKTYSFAANSFKTIAKLTSNYSVPEGVCTSYTLLFEKLKAFEHALHKFIHFEKNILFPKVLGQD